MDNGNKIVKMQIAERIVPCRKLKPSAFVKLIDCEACCHHGGIVILSEGNEHNNLAPVHTVNCNLPTRITIQNLVVEATDAINV